jgi:uncharacterized membrane protein YsdA (DUF1294 family)
MEQILVLIVLGYLTAMNLTGFVSMGVDKRKAVKKAWRIPERNLILIALFGGGIGSFLGMLAFRHKTKHIKFVILLPVAAAIYLVLGFIFITYVM